MPGRPISCISSSAGKLLDRYAPKDNAKRVFNDLVVRQNGEVITTDSLGNQCFALILNRTRSLLCPSIECFSIPMASPWRTTIVHCMLPMASALWKIDSGRQ